MQTSHGHHIPGTAWEDSADPKCPDPELCQRCSDEIFEVGLAQLPMTDEQLRLESMKLAVSLFALRSSVEIEALEYVAGQMEAYIRPF